MNFKKIKFNDVKPEIIFLGFALFFGLIILFITPPFQVPDEINHFYRAYQISEGNFIAEKKDNRVGGEIPESVETITHPFLELFWATHNKADYETIKQQLQVPLNPEKKTFVDFPNTAMYSVVSYLPQAVSIFLLKQFNLPPLCIFYGARLFALLFWTVGIFYAIKIIPFYKLFFTLIALLPMSLFVNMSLSADVMTNLLAFMLTAYLLKLAYIDDIITGKQFFTATALAVLLALAKLVYIPLVFLFLLIPKKKFSTPKMYYAALSIFFIVSFGTALLWSHITNSLYLPYDLYNKQFRDATAMKSCANMPEQIHYITTHGLYMLRVFVHSLMQSFDMYAEGYIGTLGWLDIQLPLWFIYTAYAFIFVIAVLDKTKNIKLSLTHKLIIFTSFVTMISLVFLSQHLTWGCVGSHTISPQGRYFIPVFPLFFMLFYNVKINNVKFLRLLIILFSFFSLSFTSYTLYKRYYVPLVKTIITCDAETLSEDNSFKTNLPNVFLQNFNNQSEEKSRSGKYSAKLTPQNQFVFTHRLYDCRYGEFITAEVWRFGESGNIVISGSSNDFCVWSQVAEKDSLGWERLHIGFTVPKDMRGKEIGIYIFNNGTGISYFDDMLISYEKMLK
ncbi:MAG: DUF2142 domain-containing protein [Bacteroidetes bacterium]|nr:DUF2142 domain-containing protein [Bacteroidota bacterium]